MKNDKVELKQANYLCICQKEYFVLIHCALKAGSLPCFIVKAQEKICSEHCTLRKGICWEGVCNNKSFNWNAVLQMTFGFLFLKIQHLAIHSGAEFVDFFFFLARPPLHILQLLFYLLFISTLCYSTLFVLSGRALYTFRLLALIRACVLVCVSL